MKVVGDAKLGEMVLLPVKVLAHGWADNSVRVEFDEGPEVRYPYYLDRNFHILLVFLRYILPWIGKLLIAQADAFAVLVDLKHGDFYLLSLPEDFLRMLDPCPAEIAYVYKPLYSRFYLYKSTEFCQVGNRTLYDYSGFPAFSRCFPGVGLSLSQTEGDPVVLLIDADHLYLDVIAL